MNNKLPLPRQTISSAIADCRYRAPLAPHLARYTNTNTNILFMQVIFYFKDNIYKFFLILNIVTKNQLLNNLSITKINLFF